MFPLKRGGFMEVAYVAFGFMFFLFTVSALTNGGRVFYAVACITLWPLVIVVMIALSRETVKNIANKETENDK
jgi:hypothetical protein